MHKPPRRTRPRFTLTFFLLSLFIASSLILSLSKCVHAQITVIRNVTGPKRVLWIIANYTDRGNTLNQAQAIAYIANFDTLVRESSYGAMWLVGLKVPNQPGGDVIVVNTTLTSQTCQPGTVYAQGRAAAEAKGYPVTQYDAFMSLMPQSPCPFGRGTSSMGTYPSQSAAFTGDYSWAVVGHELIGHGIVWAYHSGCAQGVGGGSQYCNTTEVMGNSGGPFGPWNRLRAGWLNNGKQPTLTHVVAPGTYTIKALDTQDAGAKGLMVSKADGFTYFVTYRNGTGLSVSKPVGLIIEQAALSKPDSSQFWGFIKDIWQEPRVPIWFENKGMQATEATIGVTYVPPALPGYAICTWQDSRCVLPAGVFRVAFGNLTGFVYRDNLRGSFQCNQDFFQQGDPVPNVVKGCFYK
jgi:hypothetical protein